jgi:hypothetical protein
MYSIQRTWSVFAVALELDFLDVIGVRTEVAAVLLRGWNLTLALLVCAFVTTVDIRDVVHNSPRSFEVGCSVSPKLLSPAISVDCYMGASVKNCFSVVCTPAIWPFRACAPACDF